MPSPRYVIGTNSTIDGMNVDVADDVVVGDNCRILAINLHIGRMVKIGDNVTIDTHTLDLGDVTCIGDDVKITGANRYGPNAGFWCGHTNMISDDCYIDTGEGVTFGDEVCLCNRVMVYTHNQWRSVLDGHPATFRPVTIGSGTHVGAGAIIAPNITVEPGAGIPAGTVASGHWKNKTKGLTRAGQIRILERLIADYDGTEKPILIKHPLLIHYADATFDLEDMEVTGTGADHFRNYLRRRGIRFTPIHWRYE